MVSLPRSSCSRGSARNKTVAALTMPSPGLDIAVDIARALAEAKRDGRVMALRQVLLILDSCNRDLEQGIFRVEALLRQAKEIR